MRVLKGSVLVTRGSLYRLNVGVGCLTLDPLVPGPVLCLLDGNAVLVEQARFIVDADTRLVHCLLHRPSKASILIRVITFIIFNSLQEARCFLVEPGSLVLDRWIPAFLAHHHHQVFTGYQLFS
jgi:hypothetical protein